MHFCKNAFMGTYGERLASALKAAKKSRKDLAAALGISVQAIGDAIRGKTSAFTAENNAKAAKLLQVNPNWLAGIDKEMSPAIAATPTNIEPTTPGTVPIVSWVQAGDWCGIIDNFEPGDADAWLPCPVRHGPRTYALIVRGLSMYNPMGKPSFQDGDTIFVDPDRGADHRSLVIARLDDEKEATFKQLLIEGDQRMLQALNPSWPNRIIPINGNCTMCGVVIGKLESFI